MKERFGEYKLSRYNLFIPVENGRELVYNTLTSSITKVNCTLSRALKGNNGAFTNFKILEEKLMEAGILVQEKTDELKEYENLHRQWKGGKETVGFNVLLTYDCNFECPYCYQGRGKEGEKIHGFAYMPSNVLHATKEFIKRTAAERESKTLELVLYGGEPFLVPDRCKELADEIAEWAQRNNVAFKLHALSNGSLITGEIINWLSDYKCRLQIPVDGALETHDKYRFYKDTKTGSFEDVLRVLNLTKGTDIETHIRISLTDETCPTMEGLLDALKDKGLNHVYPDFCYITAFTNACLDFKGHTLSDLKLFKVMPELWINAHERGFPLDIRPQIRPLPCSSISDGSFIVDPFGNVYKCWELVGQKEHMVGRIRPDGCLEKTEVYGDVLERNPVEIIQCRNHAYLPACGGGCVCKAQWVHKTYHAPGCGTERYLLRDKIKIYVDTLDLKDKWAESHGEFEIQPIEARQQPKMSHCYVLV